MSSWAVIYTDGSPNCLQPRSGFRYPDFTSTDVLEIFPDYFAPHMTRPVQAEPTCDLSVPTTSSSKALPGRCHKGNCPPHPRLGAQLLVHNPPRSFLGRIWNWLPVHGGRGKIQERRRAPWLVGGIFKKQREFTHEACLRGEQDEWIPAPAPTPNLKRG